MSEFTKGIWISSSVRPDGTVNIRNNIGGGQGIARLFSKPSHGDNTTEVLANAHLISAAPDMYEALQLLCFHWDAMLNNVDCGPEYEARQLAKAALSKANGESNG